MKNMWINSSIRCVDSKSNGGIKNGILYATSSYTALNSGQLLLIGGTGGIREPASGAYAFSGTYSATINGINIPVSSYNGCAVLIISAQSGDVVTMTSSINTCDKYIAGGGYMSSAIFVIE